MYNLPWEIIEFPNRTICKSMLGIVVEITSYSLFILGAWKITGPLKTQFIKLTVFVIACDSSGEVPVERVVVAPAKSAAVSVLTLFDSRTYSSATASLFHRPCRFRASVFAH